MEQPTSTRSSQPAAATPVAGSASATPPPPTPAEHEAAQKRDVEENKDMAALGYVWILSLVVFFARRDSPFVRFHARQGIVLFLLSIPLWFLPLIGKFLEIVLLALAALGFLAAAQGQWKELPLIGALSRRDRHALRKSWRDFTDSSVRNWNEVQRAVKNEPPSSTPPRSV